MREDQQIPTIFHILLQILDLCGSELILWSSDDEQLRFFYLFKVNGVFVQSDLNVSHLVTL